MFLCLSVLCINRCVCFNLCTVFIYTINMYHRDSVPVPRLCTIGQCTCASTVYHRDSVPVPRLCTIGTVYLCLDCDCFDVVNFNIQ